MSTYGTLLLGAVSPQTVQKLWCPDPRLGGDALGQHGPTHQEDEQTWSVHTDTQDPTHYRFTLGVNVINIHKLEKPLISVFDFIFWEILYRPLKCWWSTVKIYNAQQWRFLTWIIHSQRSDNRFRCSLNSLSKVWVHNAKHGIVIRTVVFT